MQLMIELDGAAFRVEADVEGDLEILEGFVDCCGVLVRVADLYDLVDLVGEDRIMEEAEVAFLNLTEGDFR